MEICRGILMETCMEHGYPDGNRDRDLDGDVDGNP